MPKGTTCRPGEHAGSVNRRYGCGLGESRLLGAVTAARTRSADAPVRTCSRSPPVNTISITAASGSAAMRTGTNVAGAVSSDSVRGLADSLAHPGGNLTGLTVFGPELNQKRLELLSELAPDARIFGILVNPTNPTMPLTAESLPAREQEIARARGLEFRTVSASTGAEINVAFQTIAQLHIEALLIRADPLFYGRAEQLGSLARHHSIPAIHDWRKFTDAGGLISYGTSITWMYREAGIYTGRILKGAKPANLPILQPTKFDFVVNLRTAKALGIVIPQSLLLRADEVIQ